MCMRLAGKKQRRGKPLHDLNEARSRLVKRGAEEVEEKEEQKEE